ncbi:MAG TPA: protein kinase, partial [Thermoanaerobaculia bacterium]|nr:protein kinase [Thermoanaerobaculia bacterium]
MVGTTLKHYEILAELGSGAMGTVYLARDLKLDRRVALKLLPPDLVADDLRRRRFDRESRSLAALNHPNVVTVHSVEEADGQPFIVMEWVQGRTLLEIITPRGLSLDRTLELAIPMIDGVAQAHAAGIVHRDLKPSNVMVRDDGVVKVLDFGISKGEAETVADGQPFRPDLTAEGRVLGTLPYMSPQQVLGLPLDPRSDVFSLGVILFEMLTGVRPFHGEGQATLAAAILQQPAPALERLAAVPAEVDQVVRRCLEKEPSRRYGSAQELRDALVEIQRRRLSSGVALVAVPELPSPPTTLIGTAFATAPTISPPTQTIATRRRVVMVAALIAGLMLLGIAALWRWSPGSLPGGAVAGAGATLPSSVAIAVLPLRNLSGDSGQDYFSDGTTEVVIANLARIGGLRVTSRDSVMRYRGTTKPLAEIARELGVAWVVEGSVQRTGQQVMMVVQLIEPTTGTVRWGDTFQGGLSDIFFFQRQAAEAVARNTRGEVSSTDRSRLAKVQEVDGTVYESYLKARYLINKRTSESLQQALQELDHALARNPAYALAWTAKAECYFSLGSFGYGVFPPSQTIPKAEEAARKALQLDDTLPEAHTALAMVLMQDWRWDE